MSTDEGVRLIVTAVEDSDHGAAAARAACRYARLLGASLHAVHVVDVPHTVYTMFEAVPLPAERVVEAERAAVWGRITPILEAAGVPYDRVDLEGSPAEEVVRHAEEIGADLIVVGSRKRSELRRLFLGSTSSRIIQLAGCDVMVAPDTD